MILLYCLKGHLQQLLCHFEDFIGNSALWIKSKNLDYIWWFNVRSCWCAISFPSWRWWARCPRGNINQSVLHSGGTHWEGYAEIITLQGEITGYPLDKFCQMAAISLCKLFCSAAQIIGFFWGDAITSCNAKPTLPTCFNYFPLDRLSFVITDPKLGDEMGCDPSTG